MNHLPTIDELLLYPIKSCGGVAVSSAYVGPRGLVFGHTNDRQWMIVDENGVLVSQRAHSSLAAVKVSLVDRKGAAEQILASANGHGSIMLDPTSVDGEPREVIIHGKKATGHVAPPQISQWFSRYLDQRVNVVFQKPEDQRFINENFATDAASDLVSFADGYSYLVTTSATLDKINAFENNPFSMDRFRPNIVIGGTKVDAEYTWRRIKINSAVLDLVKPCDRCEVPTFDQSTGKKTHDQLPLALAKDYALKQDFGLARVQGLIFGENAQASHYGVISVGDPIEVIEEKPIYAFRRKPQQAPST